MAKTIATRRGTCVSCRAPYAAGMQVTLISGAYAHPACVTGRQNPPVTAAGVQRKRPEGFRIS